MSKRNQKKRFSRSALKLESLEQRQLLATIVAGSGENMADAQNVKLANGNVYDQVLMTGSTVTVEADAGQVTRVDFLDADGDITRVELAGAGQLTVSLANFKAAAAPENYASDIKYVQGDASFRVTGSNETTNVTIYSLGQSNVNGGLTNPIFADGEKLGGNHTANVTRLVIEADDSALGSMFGGVRAANALFSGSTGAIGIVAPDVQFQGPVIVGDIDTTGNAIPVLQIGQFSANKTVQIAGGDLKQTSGAAFVTSNVGKLTVSSGMNSNGDLQSTTALVNKLGVDDADITYTSSAAKVVVDGKTVTQAQLDDYAKMYLNEVELTNWTSGKVFKAHLIGNVTVTGDLGGTITTDVDAGGDSDADEFGIGNVSVSGKLLGTGKITSATSVGNVTIGSIDLTAGDDAAGATLISTIGRAGMSSKIGAVTVNGDVKLGAAGDNPILVYSGTDAAAVNGGITSVSVTGELSRTAGASTILQSRTGDIGNVAVTKKIDLDTGNLATATAGAIGNISGSLIDLTSATITAGKGIGNISATGTGDTDVVVLGGKVDANDGSIGTISGNKAVTISGGLESSKGIGAITAGGALTINTVVVTAAEAIGNLTAGGTLTIASNVTAKSFGDITVNGKNSDLVINAAVSTAGNGSIGNISVTGEDADLLFGAGGSLNAGTKSIGNVSVAHGVVAGQDNAIEFTANKIGDVTVTADKASAGALLANVIFKAAGTTDDSVKSASIGNVTLDASAKAGLAVASSTAKAADADSGVGFSSSGNIGNISIVASETGKLNATATTGFVFRAGASSMGAAYDITAAGFDEAAEQVAVGLNPNAVSIGSVGIHADLAGLSDGTAGTGLVVAAGVSNPAAGIYAAGAGTGANLAVAAQKLSSSSIGAVTIESYTSGADVRGFTSSTVAGDPGAGAAFASGSVIIADKIASIQVATGAEVKNYTPTGLPFKGAVSVGAAAEGRDDLFIVVL